MGVSRDRFYRYQELVEEGGIDALIEKNRCTPNIKNRVDKKETEQAVIAYAIDQPSLGDLSFTKIRIIVLLCFVITS